MIAASILSSNADPDFDSTAFDIAEDGTILERHLNDGWEEDSTPVRFDTEEYIRTYGSLDDSIDILDIGYWLPDGSYEPPEPDFRRELQETLQECGDGPMIVTSGDAGVIDRIESMR